MRLEKISFRSSIGDTERSQVQILPGSLSMTDDTDRVLPRYGDGCLSQLPATALQLLGVEADRAMDADRFPQDEYDTVVVVLVDGLRPDTCADIDDGLFRRFHADGTAEEITTIFPSTTSATLTTMNTGLTPQEHAVPEWVVYLEELGERVRTLPWTRMDEFPIQLPIDLLVDADTIYERMEAEGIESTALLPMQTVDSPYSQRAMDGAERIGCMSVEETALRLGELLEDGREGYIYCYCSDVDSAGHHAGPSSDLYRTQAERVSQAFQRYCFDRIEEPDGDVLVVLTADHGQIDVDPDGVRDLYEEADIEDLVENGPTGSPRDLFLHTDEPEAVIERLSALDGIVAVRTGEALDEGWFGRGEVDPRFRRRIGDVLVLPEDDGMVWCGPETEDHELAGHHGGLDPEEMMVPLLSAELEDLL